MFRNIAFAFLFIVLVGPVAGQMPAPAPVPVERQTKDPAPTREWTNSGADVLHVSGTQFTGPGFGHAFRGPPHYRFRVLPFQLVAYLELTVWPYAVLSGRRLTVPNPDIFCRQPSSCHSGIPPSCVPLLFHLFRVRWVK